ncbi:MAG: AAA family ATPase [Caldimicrobium sp.]
MKSFSIASGKGGVGKTSFVVNLSYALSQLKQKVLIFDADLGLANVDIMLGLTPKYDIRYVLNGTFTLKEIILETEYGFAIIPAGSGAIELTQLSTEQKLLLRAQMEETFSPYDYLFFDIAAGISDNVLFFSQLADERIVLVTPEPTSMADAYAYLKDKNILLVLSFIICTFSLAGLPPTAGFITKFIVLLNIIKNSSYLLASIFLLTSILSIYYYFQLLQPVLKILKKRAYELKFLKLEIFELILTLILTSISIYLIFSTFLPNYIFFFK